MNNVDNSLYFCLYLTENEHYIVEDIIRSFCENNEYKLNYYRKLKLGHIPCYREVKIVDTKLQGFGKLKKFLNKEEINKSISKIPDYARPKKKVKIDKELEKFGL